MCALACDRVYCMDCRDGFRLLDDESIDLVVTSPPYKDEDGYSDGLVKEVASQTYRVLRQNRLCFVNFGHLAHQQNRPFKVAMAFEDSGFDFIDTIVWVKNHYTPIQGTKRLNNLSEFIFMFAKGSDYTIDRLAIGVPYIDKSNVGRYSSVDLRCPGNVWYIPYETITRKEQKIHKDRFPLDLAARCIKLAALPPGSIVLDPFAGGGTTGLAARQLGYAFIGFEIDEPSAAMAQVRLEGALKGG